MTIDWAALSAELKIALEARLPAGLTLANLRSAEARVVSIESVAVASAGIAKLAMERAGPPMITDGKPTILRVVAWLAHEGINNNRLAFVKADLVQAAAKIVAPNFLPMDFNHSAVGGGFGDAPQKAIGVWYEASVQEDPETKTPGILATGMMWAWLNPTLATKLLAEQARKGRMDFSMACICGQVTRASNDDGPYEVAGDTTFMTLSALDVPPADAAATGLGTEASTSADPNLENEYKKKLLEKASAGAVPVLVTAAEIVPTSTAPNAADPTGAQMEELIAQLKELSAAASKLALKPDADNKVIIEALQAAVDKAVGGVTATFGNVTLLEEQNTLTLNLAKDLQAKLDTANTVIDALKAEVATANAEIARIGGEFTAATAKLTAFEAAELEKAAVAKLIARIETLPEAYREAFAKRPADEQTAAKTRWAKMTDEEWTAHLADIGLIPVARSYLARSSEGLLPTAGVRQDGKSISERLAAFST